MKFGLALKITAFVFFLLGYFRALSGDIEIAGLCFGVCMILAFSDALRSKLIKEE